MAPPARDPGTGLLANRARWMPRPEHAIAGLAVIAMSYLALVPLGFLVFSSLRTTGDDPTFSLQHYANNVADSFLLRLLSTTTIYSLGTTVLAVSLGAFFAWAIERTDTPFKKPILVLTLVPVAIPNILFVIAWIFLASRQIGIINVWIERLFGFGPVLNIFSLGGMIWVEGMNMVPLAFLLMMAAFRGMDPALEESAKMSGAGVFRTFTAITFPLARPAIVAVILLTFLRAFESFEVPALLGIPERIHVFTSLIYSALKTFPPNVGSASTYSVFLILVASVLLYLHNRATRSTSRYQTITGRGYRAGVMKLGRARFIPVGIGLVYFLFSALLPLAILFWISLQPHYRAPSLDALSQLSWANYESLFQFPKFLRAVRNSLLLAIGSATAVVFATAIISWVVLRTRIRGRDLIDNLTFLPVVFPGIALGTSLLLFYLWMPLPIYGTLLILFIAYTTKFMPYGIRYNKAGMAQIHIDLEDSAKLSGAGWWRMFTRITLPLLMPSMIAAWAYVFILGTRELASSILLYGPDTEVLSIVIWDLYQGSEFGRLAALGIVMIAMLMAIVIPMTAFSKRIGIRA